MVNDVTLEMIKDAAYTIKDSIKRTQLMDVSVLFLK